MSEFCRVVEKAKYTTRERRYSKPQPWIVLKFMVAVTLGLLIYAAYVYVGRLCVPIIQRQSGYRFTGRGTGVALLVIFCILWLWAMWAYIKLVFTPPGFARDYVSKSPRPLIPSHVSRSNAIDVPLAEEDDENANRVEPETVPGPSYEELSKQLAASERRRQEGGPATRIPPMADPEKNTLPSASEGTSQLQSQKPPPVPIAYARGPPTTPILLPEHRYCQRDEFVKPYRAHHCRSCGTCVLRFDHHCPWIGQCVGARNHKFFINFNLAAFVFTAYTFATLLAFNINAINSIDGNLDAQSVVIIALCALFTLFTSTLLISHVWLVCNGQSTVENLEVKGLKERVKYGTFAVNQDKGCLAIPDKKALHAFEKEWGSPDREGYIWWMGSRRKAWEDIMGDNWVGWFLPVGRPLGDGLSYPVNPRFDAQGRWRRKSDWPEELRTS